MYNLATQRAYLARLSPAERAALARLRLLKARAARPVTRPGLYVCALGLVWKPENYETE